MRQLLGESLKGAPRADNHCFVTCKKHRRKNGTVETNPAGLYSRPYFERQVRGRIFLGKQQAEAKAGICRANGTGEAHQL